MAIEDIFPITQDPKQMEGQPITAPQDLTLDQQTPTLGGLMEKVSMQRALPQEEERFGKDLSLDRATLMANEAKNNGTEFQMMAGKYFASMPLISGKYSSQLPVAAMLAQDEVGPAQKQLDALNKKLEQPKFFPSVNELGSEIFKKDVLGKYDEIYSQYGKKANKILSGLGRTKEERQAYYDFREAVDATSNLAQLTNLVGKAATKIQDDASKGRYVDPETEALVNEYLGGLEAFEGRPGKELYAHINDMSAKLKSKMNYDDAVKKMLVGTPEMDMLLQARIGTAAQAIAGEGAPISGQEIIKKIGVDDSNIKQLQETAISLTNQGYTWGFGNDRQKAIDENMRRLINRYLPSYQIPYYAQPRQQQTYGQKEAEKYKFSQPRTYNTTDFSGVDENVTEVDINKIGSGSLPVGHYTPKFVGAKETKSEPVYGRPTGLVYNFEKYLGGGKFIQIAVPKKRISTPPEFQYMSSDEQQEWLDKNFVEDPSNLEYVLAPVEGSNKEKFETVISKSVDSLFPKGKTTAKPKEEVKKQETKVKLAPKTKSDPMGLGI